MSQEERLGRILGLRSQRTFRSCRCKAGLAGRAGLGAPSPSFLSTAHILSLQDLGQGQGEEGVIETNFLKKFFKKLNVVI